MGTTLIRQEDRECTNILSSDIPETHIVLWMHLLQILWHRLPSAFLSRWQHHWLVVSIHYGSAAIFETHV